MSWNFTRFAAASLMIVASATAVSADTVQLANGDQLKGNVVSLDKKELKLSSETFGELTIPRKKVEAIYMGDARPPVAAVPAGKTPAGLSAEMPSLQNPQVQQMYQSMLSNLLGPDSSTEDMQQNFNQAREQLRDLQKGMPPSETQALQGYIDLFNMLSPPAGQFKSPETDSQPVSPSGTPQKQSPEASSSKEAAADNSEKKQ